MEHRLYPEDRVAFADLVYEVFHLASESDPPLLYVAGCPLADTSEKDSAGGGCSKEGASHPITTRQPGAGLGSEHAHGDERPRED
jgi:hypothetical protein